MKEPQKPISVIVNETKEDLISAFTNALRKLHPTLLEPIVRDLYVAVQNEREKVEKDEKSKYELALEKAKYESDEDDEETDETEIESEVVE